MTKKSKTLVFCGSGPVAARSLINLISNFDVAKVITKSKPPYHKDLAPVEQLAKEKNIPISFANNTAELKVITNQLDKACHLIVIDFGIIFSQSITNNFKGKIVNSHFSLLPEWRGADPITYSLLSGQKQTGVSLMVVDYSLDTGRLIEKTNVEIKQSDTNRSLTKKLTNASNELINKSLSLYMEGKITAVPQPSCPVTYSKKINKSDAWLNFKKPATVLQREIKSYHGWPGSKCKIGHIEVLVTKAKVCTKKIKPDELFIKDRSMLIGCKTDSLQILELKPLSKNKMTVAEFLNGYANKI